MALSTSVALLSILMLLSIALCVEANNPRLKKANMVFCMHDWQTATKESYITNIPVAANQCKKWGILEFGTVFVFDNAMTLGVKRNSTEIGRTQGTYINSALDGSDLHFLASIIFTNKKYNGNTIEVQGADRFYLKKRDISIVGGTRIFNMGRGWVTLETVFLDLVNLNAFIKFDLTVFQPY